MDVVSDNVLDNVLSTVQKPSQYFKKRDWGDLEGESENSAMYSIDSGYYSDTTPTTSGHSFDSNATSSFHIPEFAGPSRTFITEARDSDRTQKHPGTFQCYLCLKEFTDVYNLQAHLHTHTDQPPFVCPICGKAFARAKDFAQHLGIQKCGSINYEVISHKNFF